MHVEQHEVTPSKDEMLTRIATTWAAWQAVLAEVSPAEMTTAGVEGTWSLKDVVAHITFYERWTADQLDGVLAGETAMRLLPWVPQEANSPNIDQRNAAIYTMYHDHPLATVLAEAIDEHQRLVASVRALPEASLAEQHRYEWTFGLPLWQAVAGNSFAHYDDHIVDVRAWLAGRGS